MKKFLNSLDLPEDFFWIIFIACCICVACSIFTVLVWGAARGSGSYTTSCIGSPCTKLYLPVTQEEKGWLSDVTTNSVNFNNILISSAINRLEILGGNTNYILLQTTLQSGSTFYVSSGTVDGQLNTNNSLGYFQNGFSIIAASNTNTSVGFRATASSLGSNNTSVGNRAGFSLTTGAQEAFFGTNAGSNTTTGNFNSAFGKDALVNNTTGRDNTGIGYSAGFSNTSGIFNTDLGTQAGYSRTIGNQNVNLGETAGYGDVSGYSNVRIGYAAGTNQNGGSSSTLVGYNAGLNSTNGSNLICIGHDSCSDITTGGNQVEIGSVSANSTAPLIYGNLTNGNVGIGTTAPSQFFHVYGNFLASSASVAGTITSTSGFVGGSAFFSSMSITGTGILVGTSTVLDSNLVTIIKNDNSVTFSTNSALVTVNQIGQPTNNTANNQRIVGIYIKNILNGTAGANTSNSVGLYAEARGGDNNYPLITQGGNVGIGILTPAAALDVIGTIRQTNQISCANGLTTNASGDINGCAASDKRLKTAIADFKSNSGFIVDNLRPIFYRWKKSDNKDNSLHVGFIAQEVKKVFPQAIVPGGNDYLAIDANAINALLVKEIQDLRRRVSNLENKK